MTDCILQLFLNRTLVTNTFGHLLALLTFFEDVAASPHIRDHTILSANDTTVQRRPIAYDPAIAAWLRSSGGRFAGA